MKIGVDLGGSHMGIGLINDEKNIVEKFEKDFTEEEKQNILPVIEDYIVDVVEKLKIKYEIESIGIAAPGAVKDGTIIRTVNLGVNNYNISKSLEQKLQLSVSLQNDGKCASIAEYNNLIRKNEITENANILFLNIGTGIGGAVIYNGKLLKGNQFDGFEFGHMIIRANGLPCKCGKNGCFEKYGSILEYKNKVKQRLNIDQNINGDELRQIMNLRKAETEDLQAQYVSDLCAGISNLINIFEPDTIIIGGGFTHFKDMFMTDIKNELINSNLLFNKRDDIDIRIAELGNDAGIIGATC
jgi:glucokinase